jgi:hypothetical protein
MDLEKKINEIELSNKYEVMLKTIQNNYPVIEKATKNFNKTQSQFMDNMFTVSHPTELRNARQILAEITKSKMALDETYFSIRKKKLELRRKKNKLEMERTLDIFDKELLLIEIDEVTSQIRTAIGYIEGAIRKVSAYINQYNNILKSFGKEEFTEEDFEKDEERYHIMKMFEQALCAARSHGGVVDEGNQIYAHQIGINGTMVQQEILKYLAEEGKLISIKEVPTHEMTINWLKSMAGKYVGSAVAYVVKKGMVLLDVDSLHDLS